MKAAARLQTDLFASEGDAFVEKLLAFSHNGARTQSETRFGVPFLYNEFWTARQRQAARIHEVSYRACFKPQLPAFFIERLTEEGEGVYDPFMGRGTSVIQAALMRRRPLGNDINPLSQLLVRPRLAPPSPDEVSQRLKEVDWDFKGGIDPDLLTFFHGETLRELYALRAWLAAREAGGALDGVDDWIRMVAINRLTGHSPGFFSVYTLPPNQAVSVDAQKKINAKRGQTPPRRDVAEIIAKKTRVLLADGGPERTDFVLTTDDSAGAYAIPEASAALVVTSPPFLDVVHYAKDNWLRCWFAGIDAEKVPISMHRQPQDWIAFVRATFIDLARIVRPGGHVAFEVGEVRNGKIQLEELVLEAAAGLPFEVLCVVVNVQEFTKTANCWGVSNNAKGTNTNRIVVARRQ